MCGKAYGAGAEIDVELWRSRISSEGLSAVVSGRSQPVLAFVVNRNNYRSTYTRVKSTPFITKYLSSFANLYRNLINV